MQILHVVNATRSGVLTEQCELANTFFTRFRGLMGRVGLDPGHGLIIYPSASIHTFFMKFPIDVLFVNHRDEVVGLQHAMPPNRPYAGAKGARYVVELPPGVIAATGTQVGDQLVLTPPLHQ